VRDAEAAAPLGATSKRLNFTIRLRLWLYSLPASRLRRLS
jgi:hypothetical protein